MVRMALRADEPKTSDLSSDGSLLQLRDVHKRFGDLEVLKGIDLEVERGEVVCVIGPSGSGKSTLLRCINLLEPPEKGDIYLEGRSICRGPDGPAGEAGWELDYVRQRVGIVFQQFNLFPHRTALAERDDGAGKGARPVEGGGAREGYGAARAGRACRQAGPVPRTALRRPAAAGRDRPRAGDGPAADAVRRGDERARPRARQGGPRRDAGAGQRGDDDDRRHPRDGLRPRGRRPGRLHGRRARSSRKGRPPRCSTIRARSAPSASSGWCSNTEVASGRRPSPAGSRPCRHRRPRCRGRRGPARPRR